VEITYTDGTDETVTLTNGVNVIADSVTLNRYFDNRPK
jgi:hypothetical protein